MVMMMAMVIAPVAIDDRKMAMAAIDRLAPRLKIAVDNARLASANEAGMPQSVQFESTYIRARNQGAWGGLTGYGGSGAGLGGLGCFGLGFESFSWGGSVF
jgi:hypothetical protein